MQRIQIRTILVLSCLFVTNMLLAQNILKGTVSDQNGSPLSGVSVTIENSTSGTVTNTSGYYLLSLSNGSYEVNFSSVGYDNISRSVTLQDAEMTLDVTMLSAFGSLENLLVVGTRSLPRSVVGSPLPIDNLDASILKSTGQTTFDRALQYRVPSFNSVNTPVNDATTLLDPYEIRNLGPSRTLILINGKRKNLSSLLYVQFSPGRGETGADISGIPTDAIKNVEILRDGASAQYGSDAIAGVMNIILKDRFQYSTLTINGGVTHKGDGENYGISLNSGANIGSTGYINYTAALSQQENAMRSGDIDVPTEIATFGGDAETDDAIRRYLAVYPDGNNTNGTGEITASKFEYNLGLPIGDDAFFYSNAAYVFQKSKK